MTWAEFQTTVRTLLTNHEPTDELFVEACTSWVKARHARELLGNEKLSLSYSNSYNAERVRLVGYIYSGTANDLNLAVRARLTDASLGDGQVHQTIAEFVKAHLAREVEGDIQAFNSWQQSGGLRRLRLLGQATTVVDPAALKVAVREYLPVDADRENVQTLIDRLIENAVAELESLGSYVDLLIAQARVELESLRPLVDELIRLACMDLQTYVMPYRIGNQTTYTTSEVVVEGYANRATLPAEAEIRSAELVTAMDDGSCGRCDMFEIPFRDVRRRMICAKTCEPLFSFEPVGRLFYTTPTLELGVTSIMIRWDGIKVAYADDDEVPFEERAADAVASYVKAGLYTAREDRGMKIVHETDYARKRRTLYISGRKRQRFNAA